METKTNFNNQEIKTILQKQSEELTSIRSLLEVELSRQKRNRFFKFVYQFIFIAALIISLASAYVYISEQVRILKNYASNISNKADSFENATQSGINDLKENINNLNIF